MSRKARTQKIPKHGFGAALNLASRAFMRAMQQRFEPYGIAVLEWTHLRFLGYEDGITQAELCRRIGIRKPSSTVMLNRLIRRRLVRREHDPSDSRQFKLYLTREGRNIRDTLEPIAASLNKDVREGLPERDVAAFFRVAYAIITSCSPSRSGSLKKQRSRSRLKNEFDFEV
jgi:DNA-binding MarR family transcriptional regulator